MNTLDKKLLEEVKNLSPFELKNKLINLANSNEKKGVKIFLNAGRGNAFFTLGYFSVEETRKTWCDGDLAGMPEKPNIYKRFKAFCNSNTNAPGIELLEEAVDYGIREYGFDSDSWVFELVDGIIGDNYPVPNRMLLRVEKVVHNYLIKEVFLIKLVMIFLLLKVALLLCAIYSIHLWQITF